MTLAPQPGFMEPLGGGFGTSELDKEGEGDPALLMEMYGQQQQQQEEKFNTVTMNFFDS
jgi:hypothetical protein